MTCARRLACAALLSAALACGGKQDPRGPVPLYVAPGQSTGLAALPVEISGRDFDAWARADLSSAQAGSLNARFEATLQPAEGGSPIPLDDVAMTPRRTLKATVPAGLPRGVYRLQVTDPRGRTGALERAFRVVTSADAVASFRVDVLEAPRAGVSFAVALSALDAQGLVVDAFEGSVALADAIGALSPASAGPFVKGRFQARATVTALAAGDRITATNALGRSGTSEPFDVVAGPPMAVVFAQGPVSAAANACSPEVAVELRDAIGHPAAAEGDVALSLQSAPGGLAFFSDAACSAAITSATIPAGASRAAFRFRANAAGAVTVRVRPATFPSASQDEGVTP